jgi:S-adenosylmethionine hydrolase
MTRPQLITLLTDFGPADYFVPAVKGVILSLNPAARVVDLTHEIPAQDIEAGAFTLGACYRNFPPGAIHLAVVDPGVGSARRAIIAAAAEQFFVGPDNGLFSYIYAREREARVFHATRAEFFRHPVSATFHGRDVFAPLAAWLSRGLSPEALGAEVRDYVRFDLPPPAVDAASGRIRGAIIHIDRFGNCITDLTARELPLERLGSAVRLLCGGHEITRLVTHFAQGRSAGELFAYPGSAGYWEIGLWRGSAAERLQARRGMEIMLDCGS